jgi:hypothetical protein
MAPDWIAPAQGRVDPPSFARILNRLPRLHEKSAVKRMFAGLEALQHHLQPARLDHPFEPVIAVLPLENAAEPRLRGRLGVKDEAAGFGQGFCDRMPRCGALSASQLVSSRRR